MNKYKRVISIIEMFLVISIVFSISFSLNSNIVNADTTVGCCEKTKSGLFCEEVKENDCDSERQTKTSCESTSFCKGGFCYDSIEGTCLDNVPQIVCNENGISELLFN